MPGVAHRGEAIADVRRAVRWANPLGHAMTETDNQVAARQPPALDRRRHQWQQRAIVAVNPGQVLQEAGARPTIFDGRRHRSCPVEQGEQRGRWPAAAGHFQALLAAAHARQPVVNQDHSRLAVRIHALISSCAIPPMNGPAEFTRNWAAGKGEVVARGEGCRVGRAERDPPHASITPGGSRSARPTLRLPLRPLRLANPLRRTAGDNPPSLRCSYRVRGTGATIPRLAPTGPVRALPHTSDFCSTWRFLLTCEGTCRYLPMACGVSARLNRIPGHFSSTWQRVRFRRGVGDALPRAPISCRSPK